MSFEQHGFCPDCRTINSWQETVCLDKACGRQLMKPCPKCSANYWIWWSQCRKCKEEIPPEGPRLVIPEPPPPGVPPPPPPPPPFTPLYPYPKIPSKQYADVGPCPRCYFPKVHWEMILCPEERCKDKVERKCPTCKSFVVPWWHLCKYCKMPNKFK